MLKHYLYCFFIAMVPIVELRGAVPVAVAFHAADPAFNIPLAFVLIAIGNMLPVPVIFFFARKVLEWGADKRVIGKFFTWCLEKGHKGGEKLKARSVLCASGVCRDSASRHGRLDGDAGCVVSGYGFQEERGGGDGRRGARRCDHVDHFVRRGRRDSRARLRPVCLRQSVQAS